MSFKQLLWILCFLPLVLKAYSVSTRTFDYVVIGGGTAGLVVAARLSQDPHTTVAVIEAGIHHINEPLVDTPEFFGQAIGNPSFDWKFVTVPQKALNNIVLPQARGKMLGGSSGLNFMAWDRASAKEYDAWEKLGAAGWNWHSLLPYFKKTESVSPQRDEDIFPGGQQETHFDTFHGRYGLVQPSYNVLYTNITDPYVETVNALGIPTNSNPYAGDATGIYNCIMAIDRVKDVGKRSYAASTYHESSAGKPNYSVFVATQATRINFDKYQLPLGRQRAVSVDVIAVGDGGITGTIFARKEVVLSAGTVQTPQILELSGIGNKTVVEAAGIMSLIDLPGVGENFQDHTLLAQDFEILNTSFTYDRLSNSITYRSEQQLEYTQNATGIFASAQFALTFPTLKSVISTDTISTLHKNASVLARSSGLSPLTKAQYQIQSSWFTADNVAYLEYIMFPGGGMTPVAAAPGSAYITVYAAIMHPFARGSVHINTSQPLVQPLIDPGYLGNDVDLQLALESTKFARKITQTEPMKSLVVEAHEPSGNLTDTAWLDYIKTSIGTIFHPVGTAPMVPREIGGVVDPQTLNVYGTTNLRVVDASILPMLIATHPQSTVYAVAERAADIIRGRVV